MSDILFPLGTEVTLFIIHPSTEEMIQLTGKVMRTDENPPIRRGMGLQFTRVPEGLMDAIVSGLASDQQTKDEILIVIDAADFKPDNS